MFKLYAILTIISAIGMFGSKNPITKGQCAMATLVLVLLTLGFRNG